MNELPSELLNKIVVHLSIQEIARLRMTCAALTMTLASVSTMLRFELNITSRMILDIITDHNRVGAVHKLVYERDPFLSKVAIQYPSAYKLSIEQRLEDDVCGGERSCTVKKNKLYFQNVLSFMNTFRSMCCTDVGFMNVVLFPQRTRLKIVAS